MLVSSLPPNLTLSQSLTILGGSVAHPTKRASDTFKKVLVYSIVRLLLGGPYLNDKPPLGVRFGEFVIDLPNGKLTPSPNIRYTPSPGC